MNFDWYTLILSLPAVLISLSIHEFSHAKAADMLGDPTPKFMGRLTLDIRAHLDPVGLLVLIITRRFGWAKPVPINPNNFKNYRKGMMLVGLAGPVSNFLLAIFSAILIHSWIFFRIYRFGSESLHETILQFFFYMVVINIGLGIFNLLPFPPLDGSKVIGGILPPRYLGILDYLEGTTGMMIVMFLVFTGVIQKIMGPLVFFALKLLRLY